MHRVSVVVPTYNRAGYLREAIESVLAQTRRPDEIIVVDDGSTDETPAVCARYPGVDCVRQANAGLSAARNTGIRRASAELIAFLDDDDRLLPRAVECQLAVFERYPDTDLVYGRSLRIDPEGAPLGADLHRHREPRSATEALVVENFVRVQTVMARRSALEAAGGFDPAVKLCEDIDLWLRLAAAGARFRFVPELVAEVRKHPSSMSANGDRMARAVLEVIERNLSHLPPRRPGYWTANARYVLGCCCRERGEYAAAREEFSQAAAGRPWVLRYRLYSLLARHPALLERPFEAARRGARRLRSGLVKAGLVEQRWG